MTVQAWVNEAEENLLDNQGELKKAFCERFPMVSKVDMLSEALQKFHNFKQEKRTLKVYFEEARVI